MGLLVYCVIRVFQHLLYPLDLVTLLILIMARDVYTTINDFVDDDVKESKEILWNMHNDLMMSDMDISTKDRQDYTILCIRIVELLNNILKVHKELSKEFKNLNGSPPS